ncbi:MAG: beta-galactosidase, partial [Clostridia bacterium]|nr:beta-galactosidase [Clostridia bacterium]
FGLRTACMVGNKFMLNGKSVFQRLILDQGFYPDGICTAPTEKALVRDIECGLSAGFNGARLHQKVFEPRYLYHADKMGYMVWGEYGSWGADTSELDAVSLFLPDWIATVKRDLNHPSIIGWCPFNETWDTREGRIRKSQEPEVLRIIYEETKRVDPTRPCIDTSGNYHVVTDIYDVHWYEQDPAVFKAGYDKLFLTGELEDRFHERQTWRGEPVFISEYGGIGFKLEDNGYISGRKTNWSYGKTTTSFEEFYARYEGLTTALLDNPCIFGLCYTQLTDVEQEKNGLFTYEGRKPKFDMEIISRINKKKAAIED